MNHINSFKMFGIEARQKPCITGNRVPTAATEGAVGDLYMDTDTGNGYKCTSVADGVYTWVSIERQFAPCIVPVASGEVISLSDSSGAAFCGLTIYGKTTQNGMPAPDAPVELESAGAGGTLVVQVSGKNLLPFGYKNASSTASGVTATVNSDGSITWSGTATGYAAVVLYNGSVSVFPQVFTLIALGTFKNVSIDVTLYDANGTSVSTFYTNKTMTCNLAEYPNAETIKIVAKRGNNTAVSGTIYPMVVAGEVSSATYEPYKQEQTITVSTPNGLSGIPVSGGGNYTDEDGQRWICDEIDFARGVYVQSIGKIDSYAGEPVGDVFLSETGELSEGATVLYALSEGAETPLSDEELAQYATLHTNKSNTTIYNNSGAGVSVKYLADTKAYIDNKFTQLQNAILASGANV